MMGYWEYGYNPVHEFFGGFMMILLWVLIISLIISVLRRSKSHDYRMFGGMHMGDHAMDILKERYAKGEIDKKEFEEKKKDLM